MDDQIKHLMLLQILCGIHRNKHSEQQGHHLQLGADGYNCMFQVLSMFR
jgi:hypothetical protein